MRHTVNIYHTSLFGAVARMICLQHGTTLDALGLEPERTLLKSRTFRWLWLARAYRAMNTPIMPTFVTGGFFSSEIVSA